jgi:nucleoid DNA-binding protein
VTKKEIIELVSEKTGTTKPHSRIIFESMLDVFTETLSSEGRIEIRNFGVFKVKESPPRIGRNPVTKEVAEVPARRVIQFKPGKQMRDVVSEIKPAAPQAETGAVSRRS